MISAKIVAEYLLSLSDPEEGDLVSHLKLQKLLYYAQGFNLAVFGKPLFDESILAWGHGPVVESVYQEYREHGSNPIPVPEDVDFDALPEDQRDLLDEVYSVCGQYSAWRLREMTHVEPPWRDTPRNEVISHKRLKAYFKTQVEEE